MRKSNSAWVIAIAAAIACVSTLSGCVRVARRDPVREDRREQRHEEREERREERHEERHER